MKVILSEFISVLGRGVLREVFWWADIMESFDFKDLRVDGMIILKCILKIRMERRAKNVGGVLREVFWWAYLMERFEFEDLSADGTTVLKCILKIRMGRLAMNVVYYRDKCLALVNKAISMKLSLHAGNSLTSLNI